MAQKIKVGIIGVGVIGRHHIKGFSAHPNAEVIAVADIDERKAKEAAQQFKIENAFADYREMLRMDELDAVAICTPPFAHMRPTIDAAAAGKHVLCEKPMALNAREAKEMVEACRSAGVKLGICHGRARFSDPVEYAKSLVESGRLGKVFYGRVSSFRRRGRPGIDILKASKWFLDSSKAGGGAFADIGCYDIDMMLYVLGSPKPISVAAFTFRGVGTIPPEDRGVKYDVEDHAVALVRFEGELALTFEKAWASNMDGGDGARLFGTMGGIKFSPFTLYLEEDGEQKDLTPQIPHRRNKDIFDDFVRACMGEKEPITPGEEGLKVMQIIDAAYVSARERREVAVEEVLG